MKTTKESWKNLPLPKKREPLHFTALYTDARAEDVLMGHLPEDMDDRWFIYSDDGWIYFLRSWTGACIFAMKLDGSPAGVRVVDSWASRETSEHTSTDAAQDRRTLANLIDRYFPEKP
jgi:hypothetical protein